jgi:hypothetical protein
MFTYDYNTGTKKYEYNSYAGNTNELGNIATISGEEKFQVGRRRAKGHLAVFWANIH